MGEWRWGGEEGKGGGEGRRGREGRRGGGDMFQMLSIIHHLVSTGLHYTMVHTLFRLFQSDRL